MNIDEKAQDDRTKEIIKNSNTDQAIVYIISKYTNRVASIAYRMIGDYDAATDVTQKVWIKLNRNLHRFNQDKIFYTWLYEITKNASIDYLRKFGRKNEDIDNYCHLACTKPSPERELLGKEQLGRVVNLAQSLEGKPGEVFRLRLEGLNNKTISNILNLPEGTVRNSYHRAKDIINLNLSKAL